MITPELEKAFARALKRVRCIIQLGAYKERDLAVAEFTETLVVHALKYLTKEQQETLTDALEKSALLPDRYKHLEKVCK